MNAANLPALMTEVVITAPGDASVMQLHQAPVPQPQPGQVLVRVQAAGINRPDVLQRQGKYPMPPGVNPIPGLEVAGTVVAIGAGVTQFSPGDRVCGLTNGGGYAEYCIVPVGQCLPVPANMTATQAAAVPETFFTVWANLFQMGRTQTGDIVLVHGGTSGIGTTALMLCREFGARALATAGSDDKCRAIEQLGAEAINYRQQDFAEVVLAKTGGRGVDVILDIMGGSYLAGNVAALARDGRLVVIGLMGGRTAELDLQLLMLKRGVITGSTLRARSTEEKAAIASALLARVWPALSAGRCLPIIHRVFPLAEVADAHRMMESGEHIGKIVLKVSD